MKLGAKPGSSASPRRDLDFIISPPNNIIGALSTVEVSSHMTGDLPPGIRFPTGYLIGRHLVVAGLNKTTDGSGSEFVIWALDLGPSGARRYCKLLPWRRIDTSSNLRSASWNVAFGWRNSMVVLGSRDRNLVSDYNDRRVGLPLPSCGPILTSIDQR